MYGNLSKARIMPLSTCLKRRPHNGDINDTSQRYWQPEQGPHTLCAAEWSIAMCVGVCLCAPVASHSPVIPNTILSWSAGPLQGRRMTTRLSSAIGWSGHPSQHLPITLPWRRVGSAEVMAGVRHSLARRKLCVLELPPMHCSVTTIKCSVALTRASQPVMVTSPQILFSTC